MSYSSKIIDRLRSFNRIIVSGPQRSGTTFMCYVLMEEFGFDRAQMPFNHFQTARQMLSAERCLVHGPGVSRWLIELSQEFGAAVVFMHRPIGDIVRSQKRINWGQEDRELVIYGAYPHHSETRKPRIADVKYAYWKEWQRDRISNVVEVEYDSMSDHRLWLEKPRRRGFDSRQVAKSVRLM